MNQREFKLLNFALIVLLIGAVYLNFFYESPDDGFTKVSNTETAVASQN